MARRHPGNLERRGDSFRARLCIRGQRFYVTIPTSDRAAAERIAREKAREFERQLTRTANGLPDVPRCSELLDRFVREVVPTLAPGTQTTYADSLKPIRTYFVGELGDLPIDRIQAKHITSYLVWRRAHRLREEPVPPDSEAANDRMPTPVANRTLQKDRAVLHRIFAIAERLELRDGNPVARVAPPKADGRDPVILSDDEYGRLLTACGPATDRPMLSLYALTLGETGARCESEALHLRWEHVDLDAGFAWIASGEHGHRTKSGRGRWVPMTPRLATAMREHFARFRFAGSPWVFHHTSTRRHYKAGARIHSLRAAFTNAVRRAKLPVAFHAHDLRHRRVTTWLGEGANPVHVKEAMGHADLRTTMGYTHLAREHLKSLVGARTPPAAQPSEAAG